MGKNNKEVIALKTKEDDTASKIELIKNLIFGDNIQAYDSQFEQLKQEILSKKKILEDLIEAVQAEMRLTIDNASTDINIRLTELEDQIENRIEDMDKRQLDKKLMGDLLIQLGEKVRKS